MGHPAVAPAQCHGWSLVAELPSGSFVTVQGTGSCQPQTGAEETAGWPRGPVACPGPSWLEPISMWTQHPCVCCLLWTGTDLVQDSGQRPEPLLRTLVSLALPGTRAQSPGTRQVSCPPLTPGQLVRWLMPPPHSEHKEREADRPTPVLSSQD